MANAEHPLIGRALRLANDLRQLAADADGEALWPDSMDQLVAAMKQVKPAAAALDAVADVMWVRFTQADLDLRPIPQGGQDTEVSS